MSNIIHTIKDKLSSHHTSTEQANAANNNATTASSEQSFSTQPHPAKTNDPADLQPSGPGGGLRSGGAVDAFHARDPYVPNEQIRNNLPEPLSHTELQSQQAALRSDVPGHGTQQGNIM